MQLDYLQYDDLTESEKDELSNQNIPMSKWVYMIVYPDDIELTDRIDDGIKTVKPADYWLERIVINNPQWYKAYFREKDCILGISYY